MATPRYQLFGDIVTGDQLDEKLKGYVPMDENSDIVSWVEIKDGYAIVNLKDGREFKYEVGSPKDFTTPEYDTETGYLHFYNDNGEDVYDPVYIGGGQGNGTGTSVRLTNQNGTTTLVGSYGSAITLMFTFTSIEDDLETGNGTCKIAVNRVTKYTTSIPQGLNAIDVAPYLSPGTNEVKVTCTDVYGISKSLTYSVNLIQLTIESSFNTAVAYNGDITYKFTPYGAVEKTIHFLMDGNDAGTMVTSLSGKQLTKIFSKMSHGVHRLEVYSTATIGDVEISSKPEVYDIICTEVGDTTPMIASVYEVDEIEQGAMVSIPYVVYDPTKLACDVTLTVYTMSSGSEVVHSTQTISVDRSQMIWNTRKYPVGEVYFRIAYGNIQKVHTVTVVESSIKIEPETNDLELQLLTEGRSNNETNPAQWTHGDVTTTFTAMNWLSTGWVHDENGDTCLRLNGDARAEINFQPFASDLRTYGKTIELEFAIRDVHNRNAVPISCYSGGIGFEVKPDTTYLRSEQSEVFCNYKDDERVKVTFVIESKDESRLLSIYLNGVRSDAVQYPTTDNFQQTTPVNISIGSSDCGIDIYTIRSYTTALTSEGVANNFIADITDIVRKTEAFEDNDIYDDFGEVDYVKAREKNSVMVIVGDLPASKGDKKKVRIEYYDVEDSNLDYAEDDVTIDVQGTSSQFFIRKNWKLKYAEEHYIDFDQLPAKVICIKVDYAEATGTHNTQNANFVERLYSEKTPAQLVNPKCRSTIYGKPILLFHQKDAASDPVFYGKSNYNYDKGAEYVFGFTDQFDVECWEFKNNTSDACNFLGPVPEIWVDDFEARYPEETTAIERFKEMHDWVVSTKDNLEKFKMEFEDHFDMHFSLIYYVYTFFALMVDQRAKNMFLTYWGETGKWQPWFYDNDTCWGINNEGQLVLDYFHEDTDKLEGANVYNGQNSVLWCNFRDAFPDEIKETYQNLRSNGVLNYDELINQFITKGSDKWSESIYNEDADFKYISMLYEDGDASNLGQVRGTGEEHFRYFIENRLNYCDGKWYAKDYADDYVALRIYTPDTWAGVEPNANITVTPFSHMYAGVRYKANGTLYQERISANEETTFEAPNETFNDTETAIYGASQLSSLGDLSPLYCGSINVSKATKLTELIIGSDAEGYSNPNLKELSVGTNNLLKKLNVRNCPKLTNALALSGCPNIEEIYASGSGITGVELSEAGYLKVLELPNTISNLTLTNQPYLETLTLDSYENIKTLWLENCPTVNSLEVLGRATNVERARLTNVNWSYSDTSLLYELMDRNIAGIDENGANTEHMWIDGNCHIEALTGEEYNDIKNLYPYLNITYGTLTCQLVFMSEDGETELTRQVVLNGADGVDPIQNGTIDPQTKESTAQYHFTYSGWSLTPGGDAKPDALAKVLGDRTVYVAFTKQIRSYTVNFYNGSTLLQTDTVEYGKDATFRGSTPDGGADYLTFIGWSPEPTNVQGDTNCYAQYYDSRVIEDDWATIAANCANGTYATKYDIGASKPVEITYEDGTSETINFELIAKDHDELTDDAKRWKLFDYICDIAIRETIVFDNKLWVKTNGGYGYITGTTSSAGPGKPPNFNSFYSQAVVYNNELHVFTSPAASAQPYHYKYDSANNTWVEVSTMPTSTSVNYSYAFVYNSSIYYVVDSSAEYGHYIYDGNSWSTKQSLEFYFTISGYTTTPIVVYNNELHCVTGDSKTNTVTHRKFNGETWEIVCTTPYSMYRAKLVVYKNEIYAFGGDANPKGCYRFTGTEWVDTGITCDPYDFKQVVVYNDKIHIGGITRHDGKDGIAYLEERGWNSYSDKTNIYSHNIHVFDDEVYARYGTSVGKYNMDDFTYQSLFTIPYANYSNIMMYNGEIHVLASPDRNSGTGKHYKYDATNNQLVEVMSMPSTFRAYESGLVEYNGYLYAMNGSQDVKFYKFDGTSWTESVSMPSKYYSERIRFAVFNNELHVLLDVGSRHYKFDGEAWTKVCDFPLTNASGGMFVHENELHFIGGSTSPYTNWYKFNGTEWVDTGMTTPFANNNSTIVSYRNHLWKIGDYGAYNTGIISYSYYRLENPRAPLTFLAKNLLKDERKFNSTNGVTWADSDLRYFCNNDLYEALPEDLQSSISEVVKLYGDAVPKTLHDVNDKVWVCSRVELGNEEVTAGYIIGQGEPYPVFTDAASRRRTSVDGTIISYWSRTSITSNNQAYACVVGFSNRNENNPTGVLPGFCIGGNGGASDV